MKREQVPSCLQEIAQVFPDWLLDIVMLRRIQGLRINLDRRLRDVLATGHVVRNLMGGRGRVKAVLRSLETRRDWNNALRILLIPKVPLNRSGSLSRFPPPPFLDTPYLTALSSARKLKSEGFKQRNCCLVHADDVRQGLAYFYHWSEREEVTVALARDVEGIWDIFDLRTIGDTFPTPSTHLKIIAALAEALDDRFHHPWAIGHLNSGGKPGVD